MLHSCNANVQFDSIRFDYVDRFDSIRFGSVPHIERVLSHRPAVCACDANATGAPFLRCRQERHVLLPECSAAMLQQRMHTGNIHRGWLPVLVSNFGIPLSKGIIRRVIMLMLILGS